MTLRRIEIPSAKQRGCTYNMDFEQIRSVIEKFKNEADFLGPMPEEKIAEAEGRLGVQFPLSYRLFLRFYGCGGVRGEEFFGIGYDTPSCEPSVVFVTESMRKSGLPEGLVVVWASGGEYQCAIDTSRERDGEAPVVEWVEGMDPCRQSRQVLYPTFADLFTARVTKAMEV